MSDEEGEDGDFGVKSSSSERINASVGASVVLVDNSSYEEGLEGCAMDVEVLRMNLRSSGTIPSRVVEVPAPRRWKTSLVISQRST